MGYLSELGNFFIISVELIRFMKDPMGNPDFKSAWDSVIEEVSIDN